MDTQLPPGAASSGGWKFNSQDTNAESKYADADKDNGSDSVAAPANANPDAELGPQFLEWDFSGEAADHQLSAGRVMLVLVGAVLLAVFMYFITSKDTLSIVAVVLATVLYLGNSMWRVHEAHYRLDAKGISIGRKQHSIDQFRSFSVTRDDNGHASTIELLPLKRFMPLLVIRCKAEMENEVVSLLAVHLPMEVRRRDMVDVIIRKLKF